MINQEKIDEIKAGVEEYSFYYIPKSAFSNKEVEELKDLFLVDEIEITDVMIDEGIENIEEKLEENERWHYSFASK